MMHFGLGLLQRFVRFFVAGVLALLPVVVTVAVVVWSWSISSTTAAPKPSLAGS